MLDVARWLAEQGLERHAKTLAENGQGLMHRFFQGYLYPSYTGGVVRPFKSPEAEQMWADFRAL